MTKNTMPSTPDRRLIATVAGASCLLQHAAAQSDSRAMAPASAATTVITEYPDS
jgi:hypothetical protein